jgi:uncharacterized protein (TIGR02757 family)
LSQTEKIPELKSLLDEWVARTNTPAFIETDPVQFPRRFSAPQDVEIAAFLAATIAWGRRELILRSARRMFSLMGQSPYDYVMSGGWKKLKTACIHRTFFEKDLACFCRGLRACYTRYGSLENLFSAAGDIFDGIGVFRQTMAEGNSVPGGKKTGVFSKHVSNPGGNSACKRLNLALRWLIRNDGIVDLGLWKTPPPSRLYIPLDIHVARTARSLGLLQRKSSDRKAVENLTEKLREFCPEDPVKYDFALFGIGLKNTEKGGKISLSTS